MKILYIISSLHNSAGMERVTVQKLCYLSQLNNYEVSVLTTDQNNRPYFYELPSNIKTYDLGINFYKYNNKPIILKLFYFLKKQILFKKRLKRFLYQNPQDIVISLILKSVDFIGKIDDGSKKIVEHHFSREYSSYFSKAFHRNKISTYIYNIRGKIEYKKIQTIDKFIVLTNEDANNWKGLDNICVIPNSIPTIKLKKSELNNKIVIAVGRLEYQKGFDILLEIWEETIKRHPDWQLHIYGNGTLKTELLNQIKRLNITNSVKIFDPTNKIYKKLQESSIFVLTSRFEGLPMVLLEAMNLGLPCISFKCKCGPKDVITNNIDGFLVEENNKKEFINKLDILMSDNNRRKLMGKQAHINIQRFSEEKIMSKWINLFNQLLQKKS